MSSLVLYYSWTGNTEVVAKAIQELTGCDSACIEELKQRKPGIGFVGAAFSALIGAKSKLKPLTVSLSNYDTIYLGSQVWASRSTPAVNTFLDQADLKGKNVYLFLTLADDKAPVKVFDSIKRRIENKGGKVAGNIHIMTQMGRLVSQDAVKEQISAWIKK